MLFSGKGKQGKKRITPKCPLLVSSPLRHGGLDAAGAAQRGQRVLPVGPVAGAAQAHVDRLAAGVHAADGGVSHAAGPPVSPQRALPALGGGAAEGGAPR